MRLLMIIGALCVLYDLTLRLMDHHVTFSSFFLIIGLIDEARHGRAFKGLLERYFG